MANFQREKSVLSQLEKSREAVKRKYKLLQENKNIFDKALDETFKPITDPLGALVRATKTKKLSEEEFSNEQHNLTEEPSETANNIKEPDNLSDSSKHSSLDETVREAHNTSFDTAESELEEQEVSPTYNEKYLSLLREKPTVFDSTFGVRADDDDILKIGDSSVNFTKDFAVIQSVRYPKTAGLLELLFKKQPVANYITSKDIENYRKIIEVTNAFRKNYKEDQPIRRSTSNKYKTYISPFFNKSLRRSPKQGKGLLPRYKVARKNTLTDYVYWDDPNELVDRLRLLVAEFAAGNHNHTNEIHSIIEELREAGCII